MTGTSSASSIWKPPPSPRGREFLNYAQKNGAVVSLSDELPQSYVLADGAVVDTVYLSELSPAAMRRRAEKMIE